MDISYKEEHEVISKAQQSKAYATNLGFSGLAFGLSFGVHMLCMLWHNFGGDGLMLSCIRSVVIELDAILASDVTYRYHIVVAGAGSCEKVHHFEKKRKETLRFNKITNKTVI